MELNEFATADEDIPILKPDHISLGKCAACHQFTHRYYSVNHVDVVALLRSKCKYHGFKKDVAVESEEEEGFVNMHHVLLISSLDNPPKELCVQRVNDYRIIASQLKIENFVVGDNNSIVIFIYNDEGYIDVHYFGKHDHSFVKLNDVETDFTATLKSDVLYLNFDTYMTVANFKWESPSVKNIKFDSNIIIVATSSVMLVTSKQSNDVPLLHCERLDTPLCRDLIVSKETLDKLIDSKIAIFSVFRNIFWLSANGEEISVYLYSEHNDLCLIDTMQIRSYIPGDTDGFTFINFCCSSCSKQAFLLYLQDGHNIPDKNSFVLVLDLKTLKIVSLLEMELTMNRHPQLKMYPSSDGSKLFVQERFENRVIFYQVFSLLPTSFLLQNIVKRFIWKNFSKDYILSSGLPSHLRDEVIDGY